MYRFVLLVIIGVCVMGQEGGAQSSLKGSGYIFMPDSLIQDSLYFEYEKIKSVAYRRKWTRELYKMIFVSPRKTNIDVIQTQNSEDRFRPYEGKMINSIRIKVLPPFGISLQDTVFDEERLDWLRLTANSIHQTSADRVIRNQLTVRPGMLVEPFELVENELLLKELANIEDAMILLEEIPGYPAMVNLWVICKDEFSWTGEVWTNFLNAYNLGVESKNLFRLGHSLRYESRYRGRKDQKWGNIVEYEITNLGGTRVNLYGGYQNTCEQDMLKISLEKLFETAHAKWAGGMSYSRVYSSRTLVDRDIEKPVELFNYHLPDAWLGRSFYLGEKYSFTRNLFLTARYYGTRFVRRPEVTSDSNHYYYDRDAVIGALTFLKLKYYKANLIYDFGRTEDIPSGLSATLLFGYEKNEFNKFGYLGTAWYYSWFNQRTNRFYAFDVAVGSYLNGAYFESGVLKLGASYISPLYQLTRHRVRFYGNVDYVKGLERNPGDYLYFRDEHIKGFDPDTLKGTQRLSASLSTTLFLPSIKRGFRTSVSGFVDAGALVEDNKSIFRAQTYWGIGFSLNLRNDNLMFKNINLRFTFYPKVPPGFHYFDVDISSSRESGFYDYRVHKPEPIRYE